MIDCILWVLMGIWMILSCISPWLKLDGAAIHGTFVILYSGVYVLWFNTYHNTQQGMIATLLAFCMGCSLILLWWLYSLKKRDTERDNVRKRQKERLDHVRMQESTTI